MSDLKKIMNEIIPVDDYKHRNGFSNHKKVDRLSLEEKSYIEDELIRKLDDSYDSLIIETLAYMKSIKALPHLYRLLDDDFNALSKIIIAANEAIAPISKAKAKLIANHLGFVNAKKLIT